MDPFNTRASNVDFKIHHFLKNQSDDLSDGDRLLSKLTKIGYFDQGRDPIVSAKGVEKGNGV